MFESSESTYDIAGTRCRVYKYADCDSTNDEAARLVDSQLDPVVVIAQYQSKGRGRRGGHWIGESGKNMYLSIALSQPQWTEHYTDYQLLACVAVLRVLQKHLSPSCLRLKYPNDVLIEQEGQRKKIAGILVEADFRAQKMMSCVCGIGLNVNQRNTSVEAASEAVSMYDVLHIETDVDSLTHKVIEAFFDLLKRSPDDVFTEWVQELNILNKPVRINDQSENLIVLDILRDGRLCVLDERTGQNQIVNQNNSFRVQEYE